MTVLLRARFPPYLKLRPVKTFTSLSVCGNRCTVGGHCPPGTRAGPADTKNIQKMCGFVHREINSRLKRLICSNQVRDGPHNCSLLRIRQRIFRRMMSCPENHKKSLYYDPDPASSSEEHHREFSMNHRKKRFILHQTIPTW